MTVRRIAVLGAESSGKSTLCAALAAQYNSVWVPEYLREFVETNGRVPQEHEQIGIARTQVQREDAALVHARDFLFCDTTPLMTALYSRVYFGQIDPALDALASTHNYALTLLAAPDMPWVADGLMRESDAVRQQVFELVRDELNARALPFVLVVGSLEQRLLQVAQALRTLDA